MRLKAVLAWLLPLVLLTLAVVATLGVDLPAESSIRTEILWQLRLPRLLLALTAGAGLAVCGCVMQALFRNPLAEPALLGVSSGASLGAALLVASGMAAGWLTPLAAFVGGLLATVLAMALASPRQPASLLLAGIAINALCGSLLALVHYFATPDALRSIIFWSMGSFAQASWVQLALAAPLLLMVTAWLVRDWRLLDALLLGEAEAFHLGFDVRRARYRLVLLVTLLVGVLVAYCGLIGFVGLLAPHLLRLLVGAGHRRLLPLAALSGAVLVGWADWLAAHLLAPIELPVGLITSLLGGPFFLWLLLRQNRGQVC